MWLEKGQSGTLRNQAEGFRFDGGGSRGSSRCLEGDTTNVSWWKITQCLGVGAGAGRGGAGRPVGRWLGRLV